MRPARSFSYLKDISYYKEAIVQAKKECTIVYDTTEVWYDETVGVWKVHFYLKGILGGDQCVYLENNGLTCLIVHGE